MVIIVFSIVLVALFLAFALVYRANRTSLFTGGLLVCAIACSGFFGILIAADSPQSALGQATLFLAFFTWLFAATFGIYFFIAFLLINASIVMKRERRSLANSLTLMLGIGLIAFAAVSIAFRNHDMPKWLMRMFAGALCLAFYYLIHLLSFLAALLLFNLAKPTMPKDYIIVLGSGLKDGKVTKLLAGRVKRAMEFGLRQKAKKGYAPTLVMSGGKGSDEIRAEAEAMREFAVDEGYPLDLIIIEDQSRNTFENMAFSKRIIEKAANGARKSVIVATSSFHLLRAAIYARKAGLNIDGIGSKTARYYMPNAMMREYIAILSMKKASILITCALVGGVGALFPELPILVAKTFLIWW